MPVSATPSPATGGPVAGGGLRSSRPDLPAADGDTTGELVELVIGLMETMKNDLFAAAEAEGLAPPQAFLLRLLDEPAPMRDLAETLGYDASNITALADKLEGRGLVQRQPDPDDRRVRRLALTAEGRVVRDRLQRRLHQGAAVLGRLDEDERAQLRDLLRRALAD